MNRLFLNSLFALFLVCSAAFVSVDADSRIETGSLEATLVPGPVKYKVLLPPDYDQSRRRYPVLFLLHGGGDDKNFIDRLRPAIEMAWEYDRLPPVVVATASTGRSMYMDYRDGSELWETFFLEEFVPHVKKEYRVFRRKEKTAIAGISMGGLGALRMSFKNPNDFVAVLALEPAIPAALSFDEIKLRDNFYRTQDVYEEKFGRPVDADYWATNNPANIAQDNARELKSSGIAIYLEVGDEDSFNLHYGTEFLHRILFDNGISHQYRLVKGADHMGRTMGPRFMDALTFLGDTLDPPRKDRSLIPLHILTNRMKRRSGYKEEEIPTP